MKKQSAFTDEVIVSPKSDSKNDPVDLLDGCDEEEMILSPDGNVLRLPSKGEFGYPEKIEYRDLRVKDEETLASSSPTVLSETLSGVLKSICNGCEFFEQLTTHDRDYVMVWLAASNYGRTKKIEFECPHCAEKNVQDFDLFNGAEMAEPKFGVYPIQIPIKGTGSKISVRLNTVEDELFATKYQNNEKKPAGELSHENIMLYRSIEIEGAEGLDFRLKVQWIRDNISTRELALVKKAHVYGVYGIPRDVNLNCSGCKGAVKMAYPFRIEDLFIPDVREDFERLLHSEQDS